MTDPLTFEFGSRSGSWVAFWFFAAISVVLGLSIARALPAKAGTRRVIAMLVSCGLLAVFCASTLSGFHEAEVDGEILRLRYLLRGIRYELLMSDVTAVTPVPSYRGSWFLRIELPGRRFNSATATRVVITESAERLKQARPHLRGSE